MSPTRHEVAAQLEASLATLEERYAKLPPGEALRPVTTSALEGEAGWSARDHLSHLISIERAFLAIAERTLAGVADPVGLSRFKTREDAVAWVHRMNQTNLAETSQSGLEELFGELRRVRARTLAFIDSASDQQLTAEVANAPWGGGSVAGVLITNARHVAQHLDWLQEAIATER